MRLLESTDTAAIARIRATLAEDDARVEAAARAIVDEVARDGEPAVLRFTARFDGATIATVRLSEADWDALAAQASPETWRILRKAAANIRAFHEPQRAESYQVGACRQIVRALDTVGLYVPGGRASYPSTVLMNTIPAAVAGVRRICMATPPRRDGTIDPAVAAAARIAGVTDLFLMGGAQAVAAFAYGAGPVPRVDRIAGPGNAWVAAAKRLVGGQVGTDLEAGPSEVLVLAEGADADLVARDLIAQAEHDPRALCLCITADRGFGEAVIAAVSAVLAAEPNPVAAEALAARGTVIQARDLDEAIALTNQLAPEHLEIETTDPEAVLAKITNAGAIFLGAWAPAPLGDYLAGPNHTLPTAGFARWQSPLGVQDFQKRMNVVAWGPDDLRRDGPDVASFARAEGLVGHARAVEVRLERLEASDRAPVADVARFVRDEIRKQKAYTLEPPPGPVIKLDQNEAPEDWPADLKQAWLADVAALDLGRYPAFDPTPWRERVAASFGWRADGVLLGNGSNEELQLLFRGCVRPGDAVVLAPPTFSLYPLQIEASGGRVVKVPLVGPDLAFDADRLVAAARGARMVVVCTPNNPTGSTLPREVVLELLGTGALVVVDEAYVEFAGSPPNGGSVLDLLGPDVPLVVLRTFSKAWGAASLRFGMLFGPPRLVHELHKIALPYNVPAPTLAAVDRLLDRPDVLRERVASIVAQRARLAAGIAERGLRPVPSAANFVLFATAPREPKALFRRLRELGVLIRDVSGNVPGHLRVSVGTAAEVDAFLAALTEALR